MITDERMVEIEIRRQRAVDCINENSPLGMRLAGNWKELVAAAVIDNAELQAEIQRLNEALDEAVKYEVSHKIRAGDFHVVSHICLNCKQEVQILHNGYCGECRDEKLKRQGLTGW